MAVIYHLFDQIDWIRLRALKALDLLNCPEPSNKLETYLSIDCEHRKVRWAEGVGFGERRGVEENAQARLVVHAQAGAVSSALMGFSSKWFSMMQEIRVFRNIL